MRFLGLLVVAGCVPSDPAVSQAPIVGGQAAVGYPAVVGVEIFQSGYCTGTLISPRVVLTAAHCVQTAIEAGFTDGNVVFGGNVAVPTRTVPILDMKYDVRYVGHPKNVHDIAVVRLAEPVNDIEPVRLNERPIGEITVVGQRIRAVGFGETSFGQGDYGTKHQVDVPLLYTSAESIYYGDRDTNICYGDSGGPQFAADGTQIGVTSFFPTSACDADTGSARVDRHLDFIYTWVDAWDGPCAADGVCGGSVCPRNPDPDCDPCRPDGACAQGCERHDYDCPYRLELQPCASHGDCASGACYPAPDDPTVSYCASSCDPDVRFASCGQGQTCVAIGPTYGCAYAPPTPRAQGADCDAGDDCFSGICERQICVTACDPAADACPMGTSCQERHDRNVCLPGSGSGCQVGGSGSGGWGWLVLLSGLGFIARRQRRLG